MGRGLVEPTDRRRSVTAEAYALDGKSARGSFDGLQKAVHLLSLLAHESGLTLVQAAVPTAARTRPTSTKPPFDC